MGASETTGQAGQAGTTAMGGSSSRSVSTTSAGGTGSKGGTGGSTSTSQGGTATASTAATGASGVGGSGGTPEVCSFTIQDALSEVIPTVGIVTWSTDLPGVTAARVEFSLDQPEAGELNVTGGGAIAFDEPRALLLGLKPERSYSYRLVVSNAERECVSADRSLSTGAFEASVAMDQVLGEAAATRSAGFILTCNSARSLILDADGAVVWSNAPASGCHRARMDWSGRHMWSMRDNAAGGSPAGGMAGAVTRTSMDGSSVEQIQGLERSHHDFVVRPDGIATFLVVDDETNYSHIMERTPDGTLTPIVLLDVDAYGGSEAAFHPNAMSYDHRDDTYTVSDLAIASITKFDRRGQRVWRASSADLLGSHGHQITDQGTLLTIQSNVALGSLSDPVRVVELSLAGAPDALALDLEWSYLGQYKTLTFGDVERLPNGNTLITYSNDGVILEVTPEGAVARTLTPPRSSFGYSQYRESLYGPPL